MRTPAAWKAAPGTRRPRSSPRTGAGGGLRFDEGGGELELGGGDRTQIGRPLAARSPVSAVVAGPYFGPLLWTRVVVPSGVVTVRTDSRTGGAPRSL